MTNLQSASVPRADRRQDMPPDLRVVYSELSDEVSWLHAKWQQYRLLFAKSERRIDLLNETAGYLFRIIQDTLFEDVVMSLARLTDPAQTGRGAGQQENLTLRRLPLVVTDNTLRGTVTLLLGVAVKACSAPRSWRNKRLAHRDLAVALATAGDPLPGISRLDVERALAAIRAVLNGLEGFYGDTQVSYEIVIPDVGDADGLVCYLQMAVRAESAWRERLQAGTPLPEDLSPDEDV